MLTPGEARFVGVWLLITTGLGLLALRLHLGPVQLPHLRSYLPPVVWTLYWLFQVLRWL